MAVCEQGTSPLSVVNSNSSCYCHLHPSLIKKKPSSRVKQTQQTGLHPIAPYGTSSTHHKIPQHHHLTSHVHHDVTYPSCRHSGDTAVCSPSVRYRRGRPGGSGERRLCLRSAPAGMTRPPGDPPSDRSGREVGGGGDGGDGGKRAYTRKGR